MANRTTDGRWQNPKMRHVGARDPAMTGGSLYGRYLRYWLDYPWGCFAPVAVPEEEAMDSRSLLGGEAGTGIVSPVPRGF